LDSRSLRLPDRVNAKGYRSDPREPECFTLSRLAATTFPSRHPAGDEPSLARTSQRWHYRAAQASYPEPVLRTTFIVGFPGETEEHFSHLLEFVKRHEFDHVGVFTFSAEEGTAAFTCPIQCHRQLWRTPRKVDVNSATDLGTQKSSLYRSHVDVLIEQENPETGELIGRSTRFSPEVDGLVYVTGEAILGAIVPVRITAADTYDLYGEIV